MTNQTTLDSKSLNLLREKKEISEQEIVLKEGDLFVAKNVLTDKKRILDKNIFEKYKINTINENNHKTILKD